MASSRFGAGFYRAWMGVPRRGRNGTFADDASARGCGGVHWPDREIVNRRHAVHACLCAARQCIPIRMSGKSSTTLLIVAVCAVMVVVGFVFSIRVEREISHAAYVEATQQSPVPTPAGLAPAKHAALAPSHKAS